MEYRFAAVRAGDKYRGAFEPVGEDLTAPCDNLYIALDKQTAHLVMNVRQHPVMLIYVLRRTTNSKQLDLHAFVCDSAQNAITFTDKLHMLHGGLVLSPLSHKSETVAEFGDSLTFLRQCGQGFIRNVSAAYIRLEKPRFWGKVFIKGVARNFFSGGGINFQNSLLNFFGEV